MVYGIVPNKMHVEMEYRATGIILRALVIKFASSIFIILMLVVIAECILQKPTAWEEARCVWAESFSKFLIILCGVY